MATDDSAARKAEADRLRQQIEQLKTGEEETLPEELKPAPGHESPREFVHRRMAEIARQKRTSPPS
jgi:hypothetical protein